MGRSQRRTDEDKMAVLGGIEDETSDESMRRSHSTRGMLASGNQGRSAQQEILSSDDLDSLLVFFLYLPLLIALFANN